MLPVLATHWSLLLFRGSIAVIFGMLALLWPEITLSVLIALFGAYAFADAMPVLIIAVGARGVSGEWPLPTAGRAAVGLGLLMMLRADTGAVALAWLIGLYGIVVGCALIALAMRLQVAHEIANARPG